MKIAFSKSVRFEPEFHGNSKADPQERFFAILNIMSTGDLLIVMDALNGIGASNTIDTDKIDMENMRSLVELVPQLLPKYVTVHNLFGSDNNEIELDTILKSAAFLPLQIELLMKLSVVSSPSEKSEKN